MNKDILDEIYFKLSNILKKIYCVDTLPWASFLPIPAVALSLHFESVCIFILLACISIFYYGYFAFEIHRIPDTEKNLLPRSCRVNEYWFNGLGAFVGWVILYHWFWEDTFVDYSGLEKILLSSITFISLTGYLPLIVTKFGPFGK